MTAHYNCPVEMTLAVIGGKWKPGILWQLQSMPRHFSDLERALPRITHKVLTAQLRQLEQHGVISHADGAYTLTDFGETLRPALDALATWGKVNHTRYGAVIDQM
jgi:DNA-binding HxlR family transcriptional regulator